MLGFQSSCHIISLGFNDFRLCWCPAVLSSFFCSPLLVCLNLSACVCMSVCIDIPTPPPSSISLSSIYLKTHGQYSPLTVPLYKLLGLRNGERLVGCCHYCGVTLLAGGRCVIYHSKEFVYELVTGRLEFRIGAEVLRSWMDMGTLR